MGDNVGGLLVGGIKAGRVQTGSAHSHKSGGFSGAGQDSHGRC